jgi:tRNA (mo5U34)-methyltransferase
LSDRDIGVLLARAVEFRTKLAEVKARLAPRDFAWYPYDSLSNLQHLEALLTGENRRLMDRLGARPVADIGCADGDFSFFLESLGFRVQAFDYPVTNHNEMQGVRAVREATGSGIEIFPINLDGQFALPEESYDLVFLLGALYHLKNPFYVLEALSKQARYCVISTRIAALPPDRSASLQNLPVAYLLGETELNQDNTNYWIFSEAGLRRLLDRTNWDVLDYLSTGATGKSDPIHEDERAFCLLQSRYGMTNLELAAGWHDLEDAGWRWTERRFTASTERRGRPLARLRLKFYVPQVLMERWESVTLRVTVNGVQLPPETYTRHGDLELIRWFKPANRVQVEFELDRALAPDETDDRERGIIAAGLTFE